MGTKQAVAIVALGWLAGALLLMACLIRRGRRITSRFAAMHPETYEAMGRPRPGFFESARRRRFSQFLGQKEYLDLDDPDLVLAFENQRRMENRILVLLLATLGIVGALIFWASREP